MPREQTLTPAELAHIQSIINTHPTLRDQLGGNITGEYQSNYSEYDQHALELLYYSYLLLTSGEVSTDYETQIVRIKQDSTKKGGKESRFEEYTLLTASSLQTMQDDGEIDAWIYISQANKTKVERTLDAR